MYRIYFSTAFTILLSILGCTLPFPASGDDALVHSFIDCARNIVETETERTTATVVGGGVACKAKLLPPIPSGDARSIHNIQAISTDSDWRNILQKTGIIYERFLNIRAKAIRTSDDLSKKIHADPAATASRIEPMLLEFNKRCRDAGAFFRKSGKDSGVLERGEVLAAQKFNHLIQGDPELKLLLTTDAMKQRAAVLFDGQNPRAFKKCAEGKPIFNSLAGDGERFFPTGAVRAALVELSKKTEDLRKELEVEREIFPKIQKVLNVDREKRNEGVFLIGEMRHALGEKIVDYPLALAEILRDPNTKDPAVSNLFCQTLRISKDNRKAQESAELVGMIALGVVAAPIAAAVTTGAGAVAITAAGIELGLGGIWALLKTALSNTLVREKIENAERIGLLPKNAGDVRMKDSLDADEELIWGITKNVAFGAAVGTAFGAAGKWVVEKAGAVVEKNLIQALAENGMTKAEIDGVLTKLRQSEGIFAKKKIVNEVLAAAKTGDRQKIDVALHKFEPSIPKKAIPSPDPAPVEEDPRLVRKQDVMNPKISGEDYLAKHPLKIGKTTETVAHPHFEFSEEGKDGLPIPEFGDINLKGDISGKSEDLAYLNFTHDPANPTKVKIGFVSVYDERLRGQGVQDLLFKKLLERYPSVKSLATELDDVNHTAVEKSLAEIIQAQPDFKSLSSSVSTPADFAPALNEISDKAKVVLNECCARYLSALQKTGNHAKIDELTRLAAEKTPVWKTRQKFGFDTIESFDNNFYVEDNGVVSVKIDVVHSRP